MTPSISEPDLLNPHEIASFYASYPSLVQRVREHFGRPLTYAEKILFVHHLKGLSGVSTASMVSLSEFSPRHRGLVTIPLVVDRVIMQDATAQMAVLQFILTGRKTVAVPTTIHCDHLIQARGGARADLAAAGAENDEVYSFLRSAANKFGMGFWKPGAGIIHQVVLENYAVPGTLIIGTDSHTPNAGGVGVLATGVGGADAVEVMVGESWSITLPRLVGIKLTGKLNGWTAPKDIILKVAELLTVQGGTGKIIEYFGPGARTISATGKATITNMGAEIGATTSLFPYDNHTAAYLRATRRELVAQQADQVASDLCADSLVEEHPEQYFDEVLEINLSTLEPHVVGPHTPDLARPLSRLAEDVKKNDWPVTLHYALIGSCTNSSYEDMQRAASVARQAVAHGLKVRCPFLVTPGSEQVRKTIERDGLLHLFEQVGGTVLANACGPCIGQWKREDIAPGEKNSILTSYNRNFKKRNDANPETHAFIGSPELVTAVALAGRLDFNPLAEPLTTPTGELLYLQPPFSDAALPAEGFVYDFTGYEAPTGNGMVVIDPSSQRLAFLELFDAWHHADFKDLFVLLKAQGKCTTDHISPAGAWLRFRGHLDKISDNLFSGVVNAYTGEAGRGKNRITHLPDSFSAIARQYKKAGRGWIAVGDENYGEGSSREHAAMEPRYLNCRALIAKSFARIHETNLKKQGLLPLWFVDPADYGKIREDDCITLQDTELAEGKPVMVILNHADGTTETITTRHTYTTEQISWFDAGSLLNKIRRSDEIKRC